jgi:hypothetical protein
VEICARPHRCFGVRRILWPDSPDSVPPTCRRTSGHYTVIPRDGRGTISCIHTSPTAEQTHMSQTQKETIGSRYRRRRALYFTIIERKIRGPGAYVHAHATLHFSHMQAFPSDGFYAIYLSTSHVLSCEILRRRPKMEFQVPRSMHM